MACWSKAARSFLLLLALGSEAVAQTASSAPLASTYAPTVADCSYGPLVREAKNQTLSWREKTYATSRKIRADIALDFWLENTQEKFELKSRPTIAFASSGGGYRSMLIGAGVIQALDDRDSDEAVSGLYQAVTYHAGLSGGSWLLGSIVANGFETISTLSSAIWQGALEKNPLSPMSPENLNASSELGRVKEDMLAKGKAGFSPVVTDVWGRFLESQTIAKNDEVLGRSKGIIAHIFSDVPRTRAFRRFETPFPIITALGVEDIQNICDAPDNATAYEFTPYEFGSWDKGIQAFTPTGSLGTTVNNGKPTGGKCKSRFDQLSYIMGTSSAKFNEQCGQSLLSIIYGALEPLVKAAQSPSSSARRDIFSPWPNPFKSFLGSPKVSGADELYLVDGGQGKNTTLQFSN
jgi:lysophospholipase